MNKYNTDINHVLSKIDQYTRENPTKSITLELIKSFMDEQNEISKKEKEQKEQSLMNDANKEDRMKEEEKNRQLHSDFCDAFDY